MLDTFFSSGKQDKKNQRDCLILTILLAVIVVLSVHYTSKQPDVIHVPKIVNMAGKQRMLSQRISYLQHLVITQTTSPMRASWRSEMRALLDEFERSHAVLSGTMQLNGDYFVKPSPALNRLYQDGPESLNKKVANFIALNKTTSSSPVTQDYRLYTPQQSTAILMQLDRATNLHAEQGRELSQLLKSLSLSIWALAVAALCMFYRCIRRPLILQIEHQKQVYQATHSSLENTQNTLHQQIAEKRQCIKKIASDLHNRASVMATVVDLLPNPNSDKSRLFQQGDIASYKLLDYAEALADFTLADINKGSHTQFDLIGLLDNCLTKAQIGAQQHQLDFSIHCATSLPNVVTGYPRVVRKCLSIVLDNALKYTPKGDIKVVLSMQPSESADRLTIEVADSGIGIDTANFELIFKRFSHLVAPHGNGDSVTGLGLALCKELIEAVDGKVSVYSHIKHGSTFKLEFPVIALPDNTQGSEQNSADSAQFAIIDHCELSSKHLQHLVVSSGFRCDLYASCLSLFEHKPKITQYAALIVNYPLPEMGIEELVATLRSVLADLTPPIVVISATTQTTHGLTYNELPISQVVTKPILKPYFFDTLNQFAQANTSNAPITLSGNVLIIENDSDMASLLQHMLEMLGLNGEIARNTDIALSLLKQDQYDVLILDLDDTSHFNGERPELLDTYVGKLPTIGLAKEHTQQVDDCISSLSIRYCLSQPVPFLELKNCVQMLLAKPAEQPKTEVQ